MRWMTTSVRSPSKLIVPAVTEAAAAMAVAIGSSTMGATKKTASDREKRRAATDDEQVGKDAQRDE